MANTAFDHASALTIPGSTTNNGLVRWGDTSGTSFGNITGITSDGSNITLLTRGEIRFSDADSSHFIAFESPATVSTSYTMALPAAVPSANDYLKVTSYSGGAGVLEWASVSADTNTTYSTSWVDSTDDAILRLTPSTGSADDLTLVAGTNITLTPSGDNLTIDAAGGGTTVTGTTDNAILTFINSNSEFTAEADLTFDGSTLLFSGSAENTIKVTTSTGTAPANIQIAGAAGGTGNGGANLIIGEGALDGTTGDKAYRFSYLSNVDYFRFGSVESGDVWRVNDGTKELLVAENTSYPSVTQGTAKAWANVGSNGVAADSYNCSTGKDSTGVYAITFSTSMENSSYVMLNSMREPVSHTSSASNYAVGSYKVRGYKTTDQTAVDIDFGTAVSGEAT